MANRNLDIEKSEARKLYRQGVTSPVTLAKIINLPRQTVSAWIKREKWQENVEVNNVTTVQIAQQVTSILKKLLDEFEVKKECGDSVSALDLKEMIFYTKALRQLDEDYDVRGSLVYWSNTYLNFVSQLDPSVLIERKAFVKALQITLPLFLKSQSQ